MTDEDRPSSTPTVLVVLLGIAVLVCGGVGLVSLATIAGLGALGNSLDQTFDEIEREVGQP